MNQYRNTKHLLRAVYRLALAVLLYVLPAFMVRAQSSSATTGEATTTRFWFPYDNYNFSIRYLGNAKSLSVLDQALRQSDPSKVTLSIVSYSSLEGNYSYNVWLSAMRAMAIKNFISRTYPNFASRISMNPGTESWGELRVNIVNDARLSEKSKQMILDIIDSNKAPDVKENSLKALPEYRRLYADYFRTLRYADVALVVGTSAEATGTTTSDGTTEDSTAATTADENAEDGSDAAADSGRKVVYYVVNEDVIRPAYMDNEENLYEIRRILSGPANVRNIVVVGAASPEGSVEYNEKLSRNRAESFVKYILEVCPEAEGKIEIVSIGENWDGLREAILVEENLTQQQRDEVLSIIDNEPDPNRREVKLRASSAWNVIRDNILPSLRLAGIRSIEFEPVEPQLDTLPVQMDSLDVQVDSTDVNVGSTDVHVDDAEHLPDTTGVAPPADTTAVVPPADTTSVLPPADTTTVTPPADTTVVVPPVKDTTTVVVPPVVPVEPRPIIAVSSNVLADLAITPNFAIEVPIGHKWSVYGEYTFPWWLAIGNNRSYELLKWDLGARYRLSNDFDWNDRMDILSGHFLGIDLGAGYYDLEPLHKGYQGEFQMVSLEYGYAWDLGNNWRLDAVIGAGWIGTHYRYYEGDVTDKHLIYQHTGKLNWLGPTKAGVSLKYIITSRRARKNDR